jgi:hypothetical protein
VATILAGQRVILPQAPCHRAGGAVGDTALGHVILRDTRRDPSQTEEQTVAGSRDVTDPAVQALISAVNDGDRAAFFDALTPGATMSDDGTDHDLASWADREIFSANGHLEVVSATDGGRSLIAAYRNDTWGEMRTRWAFTVTSGKVSRFETGQA